MLEPISGSGTSSSFPPPSFKLRQYFTPEEQQLIIAETERVAKLFVDNGYLDALFVPPQTGLEPIEFFSGLVTCLEIDPITPTPDFTCRFKAVNILLENGVLRTKFNGRTTVYYRCQ